MKSSVNKKWLITVFALVAMFACSDDVGITEVLTSIPDNIDASVTLKQDNSGEVTIVPSGDNATKFFLDFGDGSGLSDTLNVGIPFTHIYAEGDYDLVVTGINIAGQTGETVKPLQIRFKAPENLEVSIEKDANNPFMVRVSASADFSHGFEVSFGERPDEEPVAFFAGENVEYTYGDIGEFEIEVKALSGGSEATVYTEKITINDPFVFPIDFESSTVDYAFFNFGGGEGEGVKVVENPGKDATNDSDKVGKYTKVGGAETWAGTSATLNNSLDFSAGTTVKMEVYSPRAGIPILFKIEKGDAFMEIIQTTTQADSWETLSFDFSEIDRAISFQVISIFFDFDQVGAGDTFYFDNIRLTNDHPIQLPLDFEDRASDYFFLEFDGSPVAIIANPDPSGINSSDQVAQAFKVEGAGPYAGAFIDLDNPIDFSEQTVLTVKFWAPRADVPVLLKLEDPDDGGISMEIQGVIQEKETWTEVEFDFSGIDPNENWGRIIFFFDFGNPGVGEHYYFDDISMRN